MEKNCQQVCAGGTPLLAVTLNDLRGVSLQNRTRPGRGSELLLVR
jgi:hypothetical protein